MNYHLALEALPLLLQFFVRSNQNGHLLSSWANSNVGWVSDSVTHAGVGFRPSTSTYSVLRLIGTSYLEIFDRDFAAH